jgi:hypothetical protein
MPDSKIISILPSGLHFGASSAKPSSLTYIVFRFRSAMAPALLQAATLALRASGVCSAQPQCPQEDKCNYVTNNESFQVNCATDFYGGDLKNINTATLADCITACGTTDSCIAISYVGQTCYMKDVLKGGVSK